MILDVKFEEIEKEIDATLEEAEESLQADFGSVEGYDTGYAQGANDGFSQGYGQGRNEGYNEGYEQGHTNGYNSGKQDGQEQGYNDGHSEGYGKGKEDSYKWLIERGVGSLFGSGVYANKDILEMPDTSMFKDFSNMFSGSKALSITWFDTSNGTNFGYMFNNAKLTTIPQLDFSNAESMAQTFSYSSLVTLPPLKTSKVSYFTSTFSYASSLVTIEEIDFSSAGKAISEFSGCSKLENITIKGTIKQSFTISACNKLTHDSLMSIINALDSSAGSKVLTIGSTNLEKLSDDEKALITSKGWTYK